MALDQFVGTIAGTYAAAAGCYLATKSKKRTVHKITSPALAQIKDSESR